MSNFVPICLKNSHGNIRLIVKPRFILPQKVREHIRMTGREYKKYQELQWF